EACLPADLPLQVFLQRTLVVRRIESVLDQAGVRVQVARHAYADRAALACLLGRENQLRKRIERGIVLPARVLDAAAHDFAAAGVEHRDFDLGAADIDPQPNEPTPARPAARRASK